MIYFDKGRYIGQLTNQQLGKTSNGNPQIVLTFNIIGKVDLSDPQGALLDCPKYERTVYRVITNKTIDYVLKDMEAIGFEGNSFGQIDSSMPGFQDLRGKEIELFCDHDNYEGKEKEKWGIYTEFEGAKVEKLEAADVRKLDTLFGKALKDRKPATPPVKHAGEASRQEVASAREDLPF